MDKFSKKTNRMVVGVVGAIMLLSLFVLGKNIVVGQRMLDFYIPIFKVIKETGSIFAQKTEIPIFGSVSRDYYFTEVRILNLVFMLFSAYSAYIIGFVIRFIVSLVGMIFLSKEILKDKSDDCTNVTLILGLVLAAIPVEAYYWLAISSIPIFLFLINRLKKSANLKLYVCVFLYPALSEFFHVGIYLIIGLLIYVLISFIKNKKEALRLLLAELLLILGYIATEYRCIKLLIRGELLLWDSLVKPWKNGSSIKEECYLLIIIVLVIVVPICVLKASAVSEENTVSKKAFIGSCVLLGICWLVPINGNIFTNRLLGANSIDSYYSESIMDEVKSGINYLDQWTSAYDMPASWLIYNGFRTVDGETYVVTRYSKEYEQEYVDAVSNNITGTSEDINADKFKEFDGRLLIAGREIAGATDNGWILLNTFDADAADKKIYVYQTESRYMNKEHSNIPFEAREDFNYDYDEIFSVFYKASKLIDEANKYKEANSKLKDDEIIKQIGDEEYKELYDVMKSNSDKLTTAYWMTEITYYKNIYDESVSSQAEEIYSDMLDYSDKFYQIVRESAKSPYYVTVCDLIGSTVADALLEYEDMTEEEKELSLKIESLGKEYEEASMEEYYFEYNGTEWNFDKFSDQISELNEKDKVQIYNGLYAEKAKAVGEIYKEIIQAKNKLAKLNDYDNYLDMAYKADYYRDYSVSDIKKTFKDVKKSVRYINDIQSSLNEVEEYDPGYITSDDIKTYELLYPYINEIDSELGVSLKYLMDNHLFDLSASDTKPDTGFSIGLESFGDAYIFDSPYQTAGDLFTYVHEFGHANYFFYADEKEFQKHNTLDVAEIQSQGLELLMTTKYDQIYDENTALYLECADINNILNSVENGAIIGEFEIYAFEHPDASIDELSKEMLKIYNEYGFYYPDGIDKVYTWVDVQHIFTSPLYYVSYMTSAITALEIYALSYENYDMAVEKYMEFSTLKSYWQYRQACAYVGMGDVFRSGTVEQIMRKIDIILNKKLKEGKS